MFFISRSQYITPPRKMQARARKTPQQRIKSSCRARRGYKTKTRRRLRHVCENEMISCLSDVVEDTFFGVFCNKPQRFICSSKQPGGLRRPLIKRNKSFLSSKNKPRTHKVQQVFDLCQLVFNRLAMNSLVRNNQSLRKAVPIDSFDPFDLIFV